MHINGYMGNLANKYEVLTQIGYAWNMALDNYDSEQYLSIANNTLLFTFINFSIQFIQQSLSVNL